MICLEDEELILPDLKPNDYLTKDENFWREYRQTLTKLIQKEKNKPKLEKTPKNILKMLETHGVKFTARYFDVYPSQIRYYRDKYKDK